MSYSPLTDHGEATKQRLGQAYGLSDEAVSQMMSAVANGGGTQAQFNIPELGGMGQWSIGGMTMVGDMFNHGLQARVAGLCADISSAMQQGQFYKPAPQPAGNWQGQSQGQGYGGTSMSFGFSGGGWWPEELGQPASQGSQNDLSYAIFPQVQRLAVRAHGSVTVYDTGDHQIGGISQQQSGGASWTFTSQYGTVAVDQLRVVSGPGAGDSQPSARFDPDPAPQFDPARQPAPQDAPQSAPMAQPPQGAPGGGSDLSSDQVFAMLEKLGSLRDAGILTEEEFATKKSELLSRL